MTLNRFGGGDNQGPGTAARITDFPQQEIRAAGLFRRVTALLKLESLFPELLLQESELIRLSKLSLKFLQAFVSVAW
jgi:hypothetical protein